MSTVIFEPDPFPDPSTISPLPTLSTPTELIEPDPSTDLSTISQPSTCFELIRYLKIYKH